MSSRVVTTSSTLKRVRRKAASRAQAAPASAPNRIIAGQSSGSGQPELGAEEGRGHGAGIELALAADIPEAGPEGDGDGKPGQHQRRRLDGRLLEVEAGAEGREEQLGIGVEHIGAGEGHQAAAEDQCRGQCRQGQSEAEPGRRAAAALQAQMHHAAAPSCGTACSPPAISLPMVVMLASAMGKSPTIRPPDITAMRSAI